MSKYKYKVVVKNYTLQYESNFISSYRRALKLKKKLQEVNPEYNKVFLFTYLKKSNLYKITRRCNKLLHILNYD